MNLEDWEKPTRCSVIKHRSTGIEFYLDHDPQSGESSTRVSSAARKYAHEYVARLKIEANEAYDIFDAIGG